MKLNNLLVFTVLLALRILSSWAVIGARKEKVKHGACPFIRPAICPVRIPRCHSDWQCPQKRKCCHDHCGIKCLDPVDPSKPVNPGKCPVVTGQCKLLNPQNDCLSDSHCLRNFKCCKGMCGNSCVKPV